MKYDGSFTKQMVRATQAPCHQLSAQRSPSARPAARQIGELAKQHQRGGVSGLQVIDRVWEASGPVQASARLLLARVGAHPRPTISKAHQRPRPGAGAVGIQPYCSHSPLCQPRSY